MTVDPRYCCSNCRRVFLVRTMIVRNAIRGNRPIACPRCGNNNTNRVGLPGRHRPAEDIPRDLPPTENQLKYIIALGGKTNGLTNRKEAGEYITRLKRLKEATT